MFITVAHGFKDAFRGAVAQPAALHVNDAAESAAERTAPAGIQGTHVITFEMAQVFQIRRGRDDVGQGR